MSIPSVAVEHFWVDEKHVVAYSECRSNKYMWSVRDLDLESMISFSTRVTRFDQTHRRFPSLSYLVWLGWDIAYHKVEV